MRINARHGIRLLPGSRHASADDGRWPEEGSSASASFIAFVTGSCATDREEGRRKNKKSKRKSKRKRLCRFITTPATGARKYGRAGSLSRGDFAFNGIRSYL